MIIEIQLGKIGNSNNSIIDVCVQLMKIKKS